MSLKYVAGLRSLLALLCALLAQWGAALAARIDSGAGAAGARLPALALGKAEGSGRRVNVSDRQVHGAVAVFNCAHS
jgi:hypothetical protein